MTEPVAIIHAYDEAIVSLFGPNMGRLYPHAKDFTIASRWVEAGATLQQCVSVFKKYLGQRKERGQTIPTCLSYFDNMVRDAIATKAYLETQSNLTPEEQRWSLRINGWVEKKFWLDSWGPNPSEPYCMAPKQFLRRVAA